MGFLCLVNMFTIRVSLNVAITEMVLEDSKPNRTGEQPTFVDPYACPSPIEDKANGSVSHKTVVPVSIPRFAASLLLLHVWPVGQISSFCNFSVAY